MVLGARREPGDRLGDGDGAAPRARARDDGRRPVRRWSGRARTTTRSRGRRGRRSRSARPMRRTTCGVPGRRERACARRERARRPGGRAGVAPGDDAVVVARPRLQSRERRRRRASRVTSACSGRAAPERRARAVLEPRGAAAVPRVDDPAQPRRGDRDGVDAARRDGRGRIRAEGPVGAAHGAEVVRGDDPEVVRRPPRGAARGAARRRPRSLPLPAERRVRARAVLRRGAVLDPPAGRAAVGVDRPADGGRRRPDRERRRRRDLGRPLRRGSSRPRRGSCRTRSTRRGGSGTRRPSRGRGAARSRRRPSCRCPRSAPPCASRRPWSRRTRRTSSCSRRPDRRAR